MAEPLKACPFCKRQVRIKGNEFSPDRRPYKIEHPIPVGGDDYGDCPMIGPFLSHSKLAAAWNRRAGV